MTSTPVNLDSPREKARLNVETIPENSIMNEVGIERAMERTRTRISHVVSAGVTYELRRIRSKEIENQEVKMEIGNRLRHRYAEMLLNNALTASLLGSAGYSAFQRQTKVRREGDAERAFVFFAASCFISELLGVIFSIYVWDILYRPANVHVQLFLKHHIYVMWVPRSIVILGLIFYTLALLCQGYIHYGDIAVPVFTWSYGPESCIRVCLLLFLIFFTWLTYSWHRFKTEGKSKIETDIKTFENWQKALEHGGAVKTRLCKKMLIMADLAALLIAFAYLAFESQLEVIHLHPGSESNQDQQAFFFLIIWTLVSFFLSLFMCFFLWAKCNKADDGLAEVLFKHFRNVFNFPGYVMGFGIFLLCIAIFLQGHLDYGEHVDTSFSVIYIATLIFLVFLLFREKRVSRNTEKSIKSASIVAAAVGSYRNMEKRLVRLGTRDKSRMGAKLLKLATKSQSNLQIRGHTSTGSVGSPNHGRKRARRGMHH